MQTWNIFITDLSPYLSIPSASSSVVSTIVNAWAVAKKTDGSMNFEFTFNNGNTGIPITNDYEILEIRIHDLIENYFPWLTGEMSLYNLHFTATPDILTMGNRDINGVSNMAAATVPCYCYISPNNNRNALLRADFAGGLYANSALLDQTHLKAFTVILNAPLY